MVSNVRSLKPKAGLLILHIELKWVEPVIWRRVVVSERITLGRLHAVIQIAMGWYDEHLHEFEIAGEKYGIPDPDGCGVPIHAEARKTLIKALNGENTFSYLYDFGDGWEHQITVEEKQPAGRRKVPRCIDGANACPPEDIGGAGGYAYFLEVMADPNHPEYEAMLEWYGWRFNPTHFDKASVNEWLRSIEA
ncbi:plasmid pRiA4b ORF-3 family protein [Pseudomonas huanghezhanensis]|uniref:plasmid pRiA4b ORF-3 family protein n=1 Tax=Pseudomonas huanghezhanensis TaxID=3002903 RepID=UPI002285EC9C|nr:plasmid pRiA4b ORF-3 family protein [Pseudomonas sp. BSw22131]